MKKYKSKKQNVNYINNISRKNIIATKSEPFFHLGEKIQETKNYVLYVSGNKKPYYEFCPKETQFKALNNKNKILFNNKSFINYRNRNNYLIDNPMKHDKILNSSENYGYKETLNMKNNDQNLKPLTIHDNQIILPMEENSTIKKIGNNVRIYRRDFHPYSERNQGIRIIKESKSTDNILKRKSNYRIKINNETMPNNHKSKVIKITKLESGQYKEIYQKKYVKKREYINNIVPCYISKYGKKNYETSRIYNKENNTNRYFINNNYESNKNNNNLNKTFCCNNLIFGDEESKNIECPIHGNISIVIHKKPRKVNRQRFLYK